MRDGLPMALVNGLGLLGTSGLVEKLSESEMKVVAVGEFESRLTTMPSVVVRGEIPSDLKGVDYVFDFVGDPQLWSKLVGSETRLMVIGVNGEDVADLRELENTVNWRVLRAHGVSGRGTNLDAANQEVGFLVRAMELAVKNQNLVLPARKSKIRLLGEPSFVDVMMRGMFLSNTQGNIFDVWGEVIDTEDLAKWLIDEAKMTRSKVLESEEQQPLPEGEVVEAEWGRLRWKPGNDMGVTVAGALQSFFARADEESRRPKSAPVSKMVKFEEKVSVPRRYEVVVEGGIVSENIEAEVEHEVIREIPIEPELVKVEPIVEVKKVPPIPKIETIEDREESIEKIMKEEYGELPEKEIKKPIEITPFLVKNSNSRFVKPAEEELTEVIEKEEPRPVAKPVSVEKKLVINEKVSKKYMPWKWMAAIGISIITVTILLVIFWGVDNYRMVRSIYAIAQMANEKKYDEASTQAGVTLKRVLANQTMVDKWKWNRWVWGRRYQDLLRVAEQGLKLETEVVAVAKRSETINSGMFKEKDIDWKKELEGLKKELGDMQGTMSMLSARMAGDWSWIPNRWRGDFGNAKTKVAEINGVLAKVTRAVDFLPEMLGTDGKRREFMVLLQNESELRPGGGFIGSYGILSFENGKLLNFEISDIYEADGQLKGHVEPPAAIKKYLGEAKWYMRDANWQSDFGMSAKDIQWFMEKETGRKVDGVIGVDLAVAKAILGVTGEIYVPDFKEKINKNNLYEQAEFYSETKFFPGSKQKASFLGGIGRQLFEEIKNLKGEQRMKMVLALVDMMERNEIQIALSNEPASKVVAELGWNGAVYEGKCAVDRCFADYLYVVEANLGVNKANYFLYRSIDQTIDIGNQTIGRVVKISYENTAKNNSWPGGDYKNYVRMYIPSTANIAEVSVTDVEANGIKTIYSGDNLDITTSRGKKEIGFLVVVPAGKKRMVEVRYVDQVDLTKKEKFSYLHYIQRQPGYGDTGLVSLVSLPPGWQVNQVEPAASMVGEKLLFNQKLDRDIKMGVEISK
ncbi:MAG: DUF4012 domain-containing protein [Candidatus Shapirobacteria bacterium]